MNSLLFLIVKQLKLIKMGSIQSDHEVCITQGTNSPLQGTPPQATFIPVHLMLLLILPPLQDPQVMLLFT